MRRSSWGDSPAASSSKVNCGCCWCWCCCCSWFLLVDTTACCSPALKVAAACCRCWIPVTSTCATVPADFSARFSEPASNTAMALNGESRWLGKVAGCSVQASPSGSAVPACIQAAVRGAECLASGKAVAFAVALFSADSDSQAGNARDKLQGRVVWTTGIWGRISRGGSDDGRGGTRTNKSSTWHCA